MSNYAQQLQKMKASPGFVAALDQSGGSTPKALSSYGIKENAWSNEAEMFALVHQMRMRIITSPSFTGERILGAILFENTMDSDIEGQPSADFLWNAKRVVPFLKVDQGLAAEKGGVQLLSRCPILLRCSPRPKRSAYSERRCAHLSNRPTQQASRTSWTSSSKRLGRSLLRVWCRSLSRKSIFTARKKPWLKDCLKRPYSRSSTNCQWVSWSCSSSPCRSKTTSTLSA